LSIQEHNLYRKGNSWFMGR